MCKLSHDVLAATNIATMLAAHADTAMALSQGDVTYIRMGTCDVPQALGKIYWAWPRDGQLGVNVPGREFRPRPQQDWHALQQQFLTHA